MYVQRTDPAQIVPAMAIFTWASGLYVFPAIELYYTPAIKLFGYEKANGIGGAQDIVIQGFIRYTTITFFPILASTSVLYLLVRINVANVLDCHFSCMLLQLVKFTEYSLVAYVQVLVVNLCLNLTWTSMLIALLMAFSKVAYRISSIVASLAGFSSGFFIPIGAIHWGYVNNGFAT